MITVRPLKDADKDEAQSIFNHKSIIEHLGGFTMLDTIKGKITSSGTTIWGAYDGSKIIGAVMIAGRNQCHLAKFGEVGVLPEYRMQGVATSLYTAIVCQGILEGRRLWEDTIVGNNPYQFKVLPALGIKHWGILEKKTASFLDIYIFGLNLTEESFMHLINKLPDVEIHIIEDYYSKDLYNKNMDIYHKKNPDFIPVLARCTDILKGCKKISIERGLEKAPHGGKKNEQRESSGDIIGWIR